MKPFQETVLVRLEKAALSVTGIGKIDDIFQSVGLSKTYEAHNDQEVLSATLQAMDQEPQPGLIFANFNDLDMLYGHRRNAQGYARQLEFLDAGLRRIIAKLKQDDLLLLCADHGNDPTYRGTDHTREYVPLLAYSHRFGSGPVTKRRLLDRQSLADIGQTIIENFNLTPVSIGTSFISSFV